MNPNNLPPKSSSPTKPTNRLIAQKLAIVRRRLFAERIVAVFPWIATGVFAVAAIVILVDKYYPFGVTWQLALGVAAGATAIASLIAGAMTSRSELAAAVELDRRCGLEERVSTALALRPFAESEAEGKSAAEVAARRAVEADAERAVAKVDVSESFPLSPTRRLAWPLVPVAAAIVLALWLSPAVPPVSPTAAAAEQVQAQMKETAATLEKKLEEKKTEAEKLKLVEAQKLLEKLQDEARTIKAATEVDQKETLVKLNDLAKQIQERRDQVAGADAMKKQLSRLRAKNPGTSEKLTKALGDGNFKAAAEQIEQLKKELESGKLDPKQKQQMADQLDRLQKQVSQLAKAQEERRKEAEQQLAAKQNEAKQNGDGESKDGNNGDSKQGDRKQDGQGEQASSKAGSQPGAMDESALAEQLSKMASQQQSLDGLQEALEQASKGMQQGSGSEASQGLGNLQKQLDNLAKQASESDLLDRGMRDLAECKSGLCQGQDPNAQAQGKGQGNGAGSKPGQNGGPGQAGDGQGLAGDGQGNGNGNGQTNEPGNGIGRSGTGGLNGEGPGMTASFDSRVKQQIGTGAFRVIGPSDGPNAKGKALEVIRDQERAVVAGRESQTLESQSLDRSRREQKKQYFDSLRKAD